MVDRAKEPDPGRTARRARAAGVARRLLREPLVPLAEYGLWDPHELRSIDLRGVSRSTGSARTRARGSQQCVAFAGRGRSRRTAVFVHGGRAPPVRSQRLGRTFAARVWAILGLIATFVLVSRLADRVAAALSVLVLATMPLYFVHARTLLGDGVTMASLAIAVSGLTLALFDSRPVAHASLASASVWSGSPPAASRAGFAGRRGARPRCGARVARIAPRGCG